MLIIGIEANIVGSLHVVTGAGNTLLHAHLPLLPTSNNSYKIDSTALLKLIAKCFTHSKWPGKVEAHAFVGYLPIQNICDAHAVGVVEGVLAAFPVSVTHLDTAMTGYQIAFRGLTIRGGT